MVLPRRWLSRVQLKHLLTEEETPEAVNASMRAIAAVLRNSSAFRSVDRTFLREMDECTDAYEGNQLLAAMYDYADEHRIWIE